MSTRRDFIKGLGAGGAAAAASACAPTDPGKLIPYLVPPHDVVPGRAVWYATACRECPAGCGVLARVREGRVVKLEGNPEHPLNGGGLCSRGQAALQGLYNPDRLRGPRRRRDGSLEEVDWETALDELAGRLEGARVAWIGHHVTGSLDRLVDEFLAGFPASRRVSWEALSYAPLASAVERIWGRRQVPSYDLSRAEVVLSFGADFLETWLSNVSLTRQYSRSHRYRDGRKGHHVQVSPRRGLTGENADAWLAVSPGSEPGIAAALVRLVLDRATGSFGQVIADIPVMAFWWSPDSEKVLIASQTDEDRVVELSVWTPGDSQREPLAVIEPSPEMSFVLAFFDQYSSNVQPWSPDSSSVVFSGILRRGGTGTQVQNTEEEPQVWVFDTGDPPAPPTSLGAGGLATWSPR